MFNAIVEAVHGMAAVAWVGGIFFAYMALRPAANKTLEPPLRVLLDRRLRLPPTAQLLSDGVAPTVVFHAEGIAAPADCAPHVQHSGMAGRGDGLDLDAVLVELARRGVNELLVECGPRLAGALVRGGHVDELLLYQAPLLLGGDARPMLDALGLEKLADRPDFRVLDSRRFGPDLRLQLRA